jgi:hypothetical protein
LIKLPVYFTVISADSAINPSLVAVMVIFPDLAKGLTIDKAFPQKVL